jgi:hypothetical protein
VAVGSRVGWWLLVRLGSAISPRPLDWPAATHPLRTVIGFVKYIPPFGQTMAGAMDRQVTGG